MLRLAVESWIWYSVVLIVTIARYVSRTLHFGSAKRLKADDWIMLAAVLTYTTLVVCMNIVVDKNSNLLPLEFDVSTLTPVDIAERQFGSKLVLVVEEMQICTIWILKACLIIMYYRLTYVGFAYTKPITTDNGIVDMRFRRTWPSRFSQAMWPSLLSSWRYYTSESGADSFTTIGLSPPQIVCSCTCTTSSMILIAALLGQCDAATNHLITNAVFNFSSDIAMLGIGLSMFIRSRLPWKRKVILCGIFSLGVFVVS